ncbi:MAG: hypothetical protein EAY65_02610 [Alphaproteobacteria bacterium]|nr:MAG: hypothetical protein EAY65_02610 [Alphaproteobacteria bacterium]
MVVVVIGIIVFISVYVLFNRLFAGRYAAETEHMRHVLEQVRQETHRSQAQRDQFDETLAILKADINDSASLKTLSLIPFVGKDFVLKAIRAGRQHKAGSYLVMILGLFVVGNMAVLIAALDPLWHIAACLFPFWWCNKRLKVAIRKRNDKFIDMFPDVLDMIVRSVKSGFPINSAITMVAENMEEPVRGEFRQLADELALGRTLNEALQRLATRVDEQDIRFFVVVLRVQQETGGGLAEIISNLSNIIRKRKQLRHKIRAMTSEGRATGIILGAVPIVLFGALLLVAPDHLDPLFSTTMGNIMSGVIIALIIGSNLIVRRMVQIDI